MKAVHLYFLTRTHHHESMSLLFQALSEPQSRKNISPHEAASLCALTDRLIRKLQEPAPSDPPGNASWLPWLDGFFFSYIIDHIGKEFDLLKISSDGECVLNIELKSEDIGEERIKKQLEQNRYYLSHAARTIFSFTYVMDTDTLYAMNDKGYLRPCGTDELIRVLQHPSLQDHLPEGIDRFFRSADYLISPVAVPEKFLQGQYFLTNQQFDFRRRIREHLKQEASCVISITGSAGTGKTLLLFDLAILLSKKSRVLFVHAGPLRRGHMIINERLRNVDICSAQALPAKMQLKEYSAVLIDEADHLSESVLHFLLKEAQTGRVPVILAYDPHQMLQDLNSEKEGPETENLLSGICTLSLAFSGNIRINRPVYSFLRTLLHLKDHAGQPDYSCIDVLYAGSMSEYRRIASWYISRGYVCIDESTGHVEESTVIAQEYARVLMMMDRRYEYDESLHLCVRDGTEASIRLLYEGLSRTRENLCLIIVENEELFSRILEIKLNRLPHFGSAGDAPAASDGGSAGDSPDASDGGSQKH